jgi:LPXTG-motif cell wall-anchored protein
MARTNQGGSVLVFVVVAIIMAGLLIGGVYAVRQLTAAPDQGAKTPDTTTENKPSDDKKKQETSPSDKKTNKTASESQPPATSSQQSANELPKTGPESLLGTLVMLGILSAVAVSYVRSRRLNPAF